MKVTINKIARFDKDRDGNPLVNKNNKPYTRVRIQTDQHGDKWVSGFQNKTTEQWQEGQEVEIDVTQNGEWLNFSTPKNTVSKAEIEALEKRILTLELAVSTIQENLGIAKIHDVLIDDSQPPLPEEPPF